jgi:glycosyltransferase involved in cell wall biosynthesis
MKILFTILTLRGGGAEGALVNLANNLSKHGHDITVMSLFKTGVNIDKLDSNVKYQYIFRKYIPGNKFLFRILPPKVLYRMMIKQKYDVAMSYLQGVVSRIIAGAPSEQVIVARIGCTFSRNYDSSHAYRSRNEMHRCYAKYNKIVANSEDALKAFSDVTGITDNLCVLYNVFDTKMINEKSNENADFIRDRKTINFITVGTLSLVKGYQRLLECFKKLSDEGFSFNFYIIGAGPDYDKLKAYVDSYLKNKVFFLGFQKNPYKYVRQADMYICSSFDEGFSNAVAEAVILGVPVITTNCAGMREIVGNNEEGGFIVENSNDGLYSGLKQVLEHPEIINEYKKNIVKRQEFFNTENGIKMTEDFFNSLIKNHKLQ